MKTRTILAIFAAITIAASEIWADTTVSISDLTARQRFPWNGKVDIDFTIECDDDPDAQFGLLFYAYDGSPSYDAHGALPMNSLSLPSDPSQALPFVVEAGTHHVVWDASADFPGFRGTGATYIALYVMEYRNYNGYWLPTADDIDYANFELDTTKGPLYIGRNQIATIPVSTRWDGSSSVSFCFDGTMAWQSTNPFDGTVTGDASKMSPGWHTLTYKTGKSSESASCLVFGDEVVVQGAHSGQDTWTSDKVHVIVDSICIGAGESLTIEPGTIVKFCPQTAIYVEAGGTLSAIGTAARPITFTSIRDNGHGGDTNRDGSKTQASGGDWLYVDVHGKADFIHAQFFYGGGLEVVNDWGERGPLMTRDDGTLNVDGCLVAHSLHDGIWNWGGTVSVKNTVFTDLVWATGPYKGRNEFINCVFDDCDYALAYVAPTKWSGCPEYVNCVFSNLSEDWVFAEYKGAVDKSLFNRDCTFSNCLFYREGDNIQNLPEAMRASGAGNLWGDPKFVDPGLLNYRIAANSPCVDAGNGATAPKKDFYGRPRMDVSLVRDKGTAAANGNAPDIGIFEVDGDGDVPAPDLVVTAVVAPAVLTVGENATISWTVSNVGEEPAEDQWRDEVEIVSLNGRTFLMGTAFTPTRISIAPGKSETFTATLPVPAAMGDSARVRVTANKYQDLFEARKLDNNAGETSATLAVGTLAVPTDGNWVQLQVQPNADTGFRLDGGSSISAQGGVLVVNCDDEDLDVWLGEGALSAKDNAIRNAVQITDNIWLLEIPAGSDPCVTIANIGQASVNSWIKLASGEFFLFNTGKRELANSGIVSVPFAGNGFDDTVSCWIERNGAWVEASDVVVESGISGHALFDVTGCELGDWNLYVGRNGVWRSVPLLTLVQPQGSAHFVGEVDILDTIRANRAYVGTFRYKNDGDMPTNAPYVRLEAKGDTLIRLSTADAWAKSVEFLAASDTYPASILTPGASSSVTFFYQATGGDAEIEYAYTLSSAEAFPWADAETDLRPSWASDELWVFAFATLRRSFGETWDSYLDRLRHDCDHLMRVGSPVKRLDRIWQLEINEALGNDAVLPQLASATDLARSARGLGLSFSRSYSSSLRGRLASGILGYGWTDNFSSYAEKLDDDTLVFHLPSGGSYSFTKITGEWKPQDARDKTELTETGSEYILKYASGTVQRFSKTTRKTSSIADRVGNTLSFTYSGGKLTRLAHSDGQSLTFTYSGGRLAKARDDQGRTVKYAYSNGNLTSVTAFNGLVTRYEYVSAPGTPRDKALSRIVHPDGTTTEFEYDDSGLLAATSANGGQLCTRIERGDFGCHSIVAPNGYATAVTVGASGETLKTVNAKGETVRQTYTADTLLESTILPSGRRSALTHDRDGNPVTASSASGATTTFSYEPEFGALASVTDAKGHAFRYEYDEEGRNVSVAYADGSEATVEYDARGDMVHSTNRRGETISFEYDGEGRLKKKTWPNGRTFTLTYDAKGNVISAADSVTGTVTMEYDGKERMKRIVYPKGRGFTFEYDDAGRTIERASLDGTKECYEYDSFGRLSRVTDGGGNAYLTNAYDPTTGWLATQTYGNGTVVSNAYDVLGRTVGIYHLKNGSRLAFFEYEYDEDGRCVSQTTAEGVESYTYDADGQLTAVTYPDGTSETFAYDAVGNRLDYTVNELNQYLSGNGATFAYDADGNMTSRTDADGTTTYCYDVLNRLVAVTNETKGVRWSCEYDVFGNRVSVTDNGVTIERVFVQGSLPSVAAEYVDGALSTRHILVGAVRIADVATTPSSSRYYHSDLIGSTRLTTDGTGATKSTRSFKAFGETRIATGETTDAGYVGTLGIETDPTGLLFMRNRYYDAGLGRFAQMDPIGLEGGNLTLFSYCNNCPIAYADIEGKAPRWLCGNHWDRNIEFANSGVCPQTKDEAIERGLEKQSVEDSQYHCEGREKYLSPVDKIVECVYRQDGTLETDWNCIGTPNNYGPAWLPEWYRKGFIHGPTDVLPYWICGNHPLDTTPFIDRIYNSRVLEINKKIEADNQRKICSPIVQSEDPNEIVGKQGVGAKRYVEAGERLTYTIYFENKPEATAAAQEVTVVLPMDANLDWTTLELGEIAFGDNIDMGLSRKKRGTSNYANPGTNTFVRTKVSVEDGCLKWYIRDWDPTTTDNFPEDARGGFLPPNVKDEDNPNNPLNGCGEGHVSFSVCVKTNAVIGTRINASANIQFDKNAWIETDPSWFNTVGSDEPLPIHRFYSKAYKGHFFTISEEEKEDLIAHNPNWKYEGVAYQAYTNEAAGTTALFRFYSKGYRGHFFTIDADEAEAVKRNRNWKYEGIAYYVYPEEVEGSVPVFRFWSKRYRHHFYTTNEEEKEDLRAHNPNWKYEGIAFYALPAEETGREAIRSASERRAIPAPGDDEGGSRGVLALPEADGAVNGLRGALALPEADDAVNGSRGALAPPETVAAEAAWTLATDGGAAVAVPGTTEVEVGEAIVETRTDAPDELAAARSENAPSRSGDDATLALHLTLPDGVFGATLWSAAEGTLAEEEAEGAFDFALPATSVWHWLRVRDEKGTDAFSLWLRAE